MKVRIFKPEVDMKLKLSTLALATFLVVAGCDSSDVTRASDPSPSNEVAAALQTELELSADQASVVEGILVENRDLWDVARYLQDNLSVEEKADLVQRAADARVERSAKARQRFDKRKRGAKGTRGARQAGRANLSEAQAELLKQHRESMRSAMQQAREDGNVSEEEKEELRALRKSQREDFAATLTDEQREKAATYRERRSSKPIHRRQRSGENELGLSEDQIERMREIREDFKEKAEQLRAADGPIDRDAARELRSELREAMDAVLTEEQKELRDLHRAVVGVAGHKMRNRDRARR